MPAQSPLLALAPELRNRIYHHALAESRELYIITEDGDAQAQPALLRTCRQIRREALRMYYNENCFVAVVVEGQTERVIAWLSSLGHRVGPYIKHLSIEIVNESTSQRYLLSAISKIEAALNRHHRSQSLGCAAEARLPMNTTVSATLPSPPSPSLTIPPRQPKDRMSWSHLFATINKTAIWTQSLHFRLPYGVESRIDAFVNHHRVGPPMPLMFIQPIYGGPVFPVQTEQMRILAEEKQSMEEVRKKFHAQRESYHSHVTRHAYWRRRYRGWDSGRHGGVTAEATGWDDLYDTFSS